MAFSAFAHHHEPYPVHTDSPIPQPQWNKTAQPRSSQCPSAAPPSAVTAHPRPMGKLISFFFFLSFVSCCLLLRVVLAGWARTARHASLLVTAGALLFKADFPLPACLNSTHGPRPQARQLVPPKNKDCTGLTEREMASLVRLHGPRRGSIADSVWLAMAGRRTARVSYKGVQLLVNLPFFFLLSR